MFKPEKNAYNTKTNEKEKQQKMAIKKFNEMFKVLSLIVILFLLCLIYIYIAIHFVQPHYFIFVKNGGYTHLYPLS